MRHNFSGRPAEYRRRAALSVDVRAFVEGHLRDLARAGRLREVARSRDALAAYYRAQGNDAASYCLASAPDFSLGRHPAVAPCSPCAAVATWFRGHSWNCWQRPRMRRVKSRAASSSWRVARTASKR